VDDFRRIGLDLTSFQIIAITPPEDVQRRIDERTTMSILGDAGNSRQSGSAQALGGGANRPAIEAPQTELELGAGLGAEQAVPPTRRETLLEPARRGRAGTIECPHCHAQAPADARFCPNCGRALQAQAGQ
jgi:membrane protease subunit (stomatin/prohibitin family)